MMMLTVVVTQRMVDRTQSAADLCGTPSPPNIYTARRPTRTPASAAAAAAVRAAGTAIRTRNLAGRADASLFGGPQGCRSAGVPGRIASGGNFKPRRVPGWISTAAPHGGKARNYD